LAKRIQLDPLLEAERDERLARITTRLGDYEPLSATLAWIDTLRAIEEFINLQTVDWPPGFEATLYGMPVAGIAFDPGPLREVIPHLHHRFGQNFVARFTRLVTQLASVAIAFAGQGVHEVVTELASVGSTIGFLQSRRRHFVAMLYALPIVCSGTVRFDPLNTLNDILPPIEFEGTALVFLENQIMMDAARKALGAAGVLPEDDLAMLDDLFLEPERLRITEAEVADHKALEERLEPVAADRIFSAAELRNDLVATEESYREFDLDSTAFPPVAALIRRLSREFIDKDFWIRIDPPGFDRLCDEHGLSPAARRAMVAPTGDYFQCLASHAALVLVAGTYLSTVTLLSRFAYYWRDRSLAKVKRYQIRSGFLFEKAVTAAIVEQGFEPTGEKRIEKQEFDVLARRDGILWNIQCKNNISDLSRLAAEPLLFARYNKGLVRSYARALAKEEGREQLLRTRFGDVEVRHLVVSRMPVVGGEARVVPFSRVGGLADYADRLAS
jgi:hypothetical protein